MQRDTCKMRKIREKTPKASDTCESFDENFFLITRKEFNFFKKHSGNLEDSYDVIVINGFKTSDLLTLDHHHWGHPARILAPKEDKCINEFGQNENRHHDLLLKIVDYYDDERTPSINGQPSGCGTANTLATSCLLTTSGQFRSTATINLHSSGKSRGSTIFFQGSPEAKITYQSGRSVTIMREYTKSFRL